MNSKHRLSVGVGAALLAAAVAGTALSTSTTFKGRNGRLLYQAQVDRTRSSSPSSRTAPA